MTDEPMNDTEAAADAPAALDPPAEAAPLPDRLSLDPMSDHHDPELLQRGVGIRFNGNERTNVEDYCVSEGWIRVAAGRTLDRRGRPMTVKLRGVVEPYLR